METFVWLVVKTAKIDTGTLDLKSSLLFKKGMGIFINQRPDIPKVNKNILISKEYQYSLGMPNILSKKYIESKVEGQWLLGSVLSCSCPCNAAVARGINTILSR